MTEYTRQNRLPGHEYSRRLDARLTKPRRPWIKILAAVLIAALALWLVPAYLLAVICLGGPTALLAWFLWSARAEAKEYNKERDLP